jgi:hypothetical protein
VPEEQVVEAIVRAFTADMPMSLPPEATPQERWTAEPRIRSLLERNPDRRRFEAGMIIFSAYRPGDDWNQVLDRLSPRDLQLLRELAPYLPPQAAQLFQQRFIWFT